MGRVSKRIHNIRKGYIFESKNYGKASVVDYVNSKEVWVRFLDSGFLTRVSTGNLIKGLFRDASKPKPSRKNNKSLVEKTIVRLDELLNTSYFKLLYLQEDYTDYRGYAFLWCNIHGKTFSKRVKDLYRYPHSCTCNYRDYSDNEKIKTDIMGTLKYPYWEFKNFDSDVLNSNTRVSFYCHKHSKDFNVNLSHVFTKRYNCKDCKNEHLSEVGFEPLSSILEKANKHKLPDIFNLSRSDFKDSKGQKKVTYSCSNCSFDIYVKEQVCSGVFTTDATRLKSGSRSCRCGSFRPNLPQQTLRVQLKLDTLGGEWVGWESEDKYRAKDNFHCRCPEGHNYTVSVDNFIRHGLRCNSCVKYGFDYNLPAELYITRWYGFGESYLKTGITNSDATYRVYKQSLINTSMDYELLYRIPFNRGEDAHIVEQEVKRLVGSYTAPRKRLPSGFSETSEDSVENLNKILSIAGFYLGGDK
ncbi:hypothetical protein NVP1084O_056 [Vibrio phage 1.084.O._10N.261.49.F5]|nr:hypothetical protein NVP1084O_056 [Vibrio phage 1.084.O._10N.261.49.F5]